MNIPKISALYESSLASALSSSGTLFTLVSATDRDGNALSGRYGFIIDEGSADEEFIIGTVSGTTVTSEYRGIDADAPNTEVSANKKSHRRGASVKITDYPIMGVLRNILNGDETLPNPLKYAAGVVPVTSDDLVDKAYADALVGGGTLSYDKIVIAGNAGETVSAGQVLYLNTTDGEWYKADADTAAQVENINLGLAQGAGTDGNAITGGILTYGLDTNQTGLTNNTKYYASNTAGGLSSSAGTREVTLGVSRSTTSIFFSPRFDQQITEDLQDALEGSSGTPSSTNKFITSDNTSNDSVDQSQTTQNGTIETGEADATTKKNLIAQSFIPAKSKIRGVKLYKSADTGTFTGSVVVTLQADSSGSPSGTPLATCTLTNIQWTANAVGEIECLFSSEYTSLTTGSLYWIVIDPSTSDTSNHPNLGTNTAGGYGSGSVKYKNTTDSWVSVSTIDLYFKTMEGTTSQVIKANSSGKLETTFFALSEMPIPAFQQRIETTIIGSDDDTQERYLAGTTCNTTGSVVYALLNGISDTGELQRFERDSLTGQYFLTHQVATTSIPTASNHGMVVLGSYLYIYYDNGANMACYRYDASNLANETTMTVPVIAIGGATDDMMAWTDGTFLYFHPVETAPTTVYKQSVSGTTISAVTTGTPNSTFDDYSIGSTFFDGTNIYGVRDTGSNNIVNLYKFNDVYASSPNVSSKVFSRFGFSSGSSYSLGCANIDSERMYLIRPTYSSITSTGTTVKNYLEFFPVSKPV